MLQSLLKMLATFKMRLWYDKTKIEENVVGNIDIRCSNFGKTNGSSVDRTNANYKDVMTNFLLNTMLYHAGMSCIIKTN